MTYIVNTLVQRIWV